MIGLSCSDHSFPKLAHSAVLDLIASLGLSAVDIGVMSGSAHTTPESVSEHADRAGTQLRAQCSNAGLVVADVFPIVVTDWRPQEDVRSASLNHPDSRVRDASRDSFRRFGDFAAACGAPGLTILPGTPFPGVSTATSFAAAVDELAWRVATAAELSLSLGFEAHVGSIAESPATAWGLLNAVPGLMLTLDYSHFLYQGISVDEVETLHRRARHHQVRQASRGVMQAVAHEGDLDVQRMVQAIVAVGYTGYIATEYVWNRKWDCDRVDVLSETSLLLDELTRSLKSIKGEPSDRSIAEFAS